MVNRIEEFPIPLVYKLISRGKSSGEFIVRGRGFRKKFYFTQGKLDFSESSLAEERLIDILLLIGVLERDQAVRIKAKAGANPTTKVGQLLVRQGIISEKKLYDCLIAQSIQIAANTFGLTEGEWEYIPSDSRLPPGKTYRIELARIAVQGVRQIHDFSVYKSLFGRCLIRTGHCSEKSKRLLSPFEVKLLSRISGRTDRTVSEILQRVTFPAEIFWREVIKFYLLHVIEFSDTDSDKWASNTETMIQAVIDMDITKPSSTGLRGLLLKASPPPSPPLPEEESQEMEKTEPQLPEAVEANPAGNPSESGSISRVDASLRMGEKLFKEGKYRDASLILKRVVRPETSSAGHLLLLGMCLARLAESENEAEQYLWLAAEKDPDDSEPYFALGNFYRERNNFREALNAYQRAMKIFQTQVRSGKISENPDASGRKKSLFALRRNKTP